MTYKKNKLLREFIQNELPAIMETRDRVNLYSGYLEATTFLLDNDYIKQNDQDKLKKHKAHIEELFNNLMKELNDNVDKVIGNKQENDLKENDLISWMEQK